MISVQKFTVGEFQENTYVLFDETKKCVIIDPGCFRASERQQLSSFIESNKLKPVKLLNTHCHIDHVLGNAFVADTYQIPFYLHEGELFTYKDTARWTVLLGIPPLEVPENKVFVSEKDTITFGNSELKIAFTPGHSIASITFYNLEERLAVVGDVLFYESIGRTDLAGGNHAVLLESIRRELLVWPDDMRVLSGHGPETSIGHERRFNPYLS